MLPYEGIRILDFTQLEQGPSGTQVLADFGADVIKVERPIVGELGRRQWPTLANGYSPHWSATNRNKRSITIDLKNSEGIQIVLDLVRSADIVASNFRPGVMEKLGLGFEWLSEINPRVIVAYASGYGQTGPMAQFRGQDLAAQAMSGLMNLTGPREGAQTPVGTFIVDYIASMQFAQGMMLALAAREKTGRGQVVDSCLLNAAIASHLQEGTAFLMTSTPYGRAIENVAHVYNTALYGYYETRDGAWVALIGEFYITEPWQRTARALRMAGEVVTDERFQTIEGLREHLEETRNLVRDHFMQLTAEDALARLEDEDVLAVPVLAYPEVFANEQVRHNEMVLTTELQTVGEAKFVGMPVKLSDTPGQLRIGPPRLGEHNIDVLSETGRGSEDIERLRESGAIGDEQQRFERDGVVSW